MSARRGAWPAGGVAALGVVTEGYLRLWTEHRQHLERLQALKDEAFRYVKDGAQTRPSGMSVHVMACGTVCRYGLPVCHGVRHTVRAAR